jgi:hypothetical protein
MYIQKYRFYLIAGFVVLCLLNSLGCSEKPANWYYYWEKDNVINGLDSSGSPASRWTSNTTNYGAASGYDNGYVISDLCIKSPAQVPIEVIHIVTHAHIFIGCTTTKGIEAAATTMAHEKQHITNYQFIHSGNADTDGDGLADSQEGAGHYDLLIGSKDTYDLKTACGYNPYGNYGDNEFICRKDAEPTGLALANKNQDWSKKGAQWQHEE